VPFQKTYYICEIGIYYFSNSISCDEFEKYARHFLPLYSNLVFKYCISTLNVKVEKGENMLHYKKDGFILSGSYDHHQLLMDIVLLLSRYIEFELNKLLFFSIHSSCISINSKAFLFLGPSASGKTITVAACNRKNPEIIVLSGERSIIKGEYVVGGTTTLSFRNGSLINDFPEFNNYVLSEHDPWLSYSLIDYPPSVFSQSYKIGAFIFLKVCNEKFRFSKFNAPDPFWKLYEQIAHFAEVFPLIVAGQKKPLPSFYSAKIAKNRIVYTENLVKTIPLYSLSGCFRDIEENTIEILQKISDG